MSGHVYKGVPGLDWPLGIFIREYLVWVASGYVYKGVSEFGYCLGMSITECLDWVDL